jgi:hypothetical protein
VEERLVSVARATVQFSMSTDMYRVWDDLELSHAGMPARVRIPVLPRATFRLFYELLGGVRLGFLVVSPS